MKFLCISVRDIATNNHEAPMIVRHRMEAIRAIEQIVNNDAGNNSPPLVQNLRQYPNQFELVVLAEWDSETGAYENKNENIGQCSSFVHTNN